MSTRPVERSSAGRTSRCTDWRRLVRSKLLSFATTTKPNKASRTPRAASTKRCFLPVLCRSASFASCFSRALARRCDCRPRRPRVRANSPASKNGPAANRSWRNTRRSKKVAASARIESYRCSIPGLAGFTKSPSPTAITEKTWRRERDSNPRYPFGYTSFPGVHLKPLGHLSRYEKIPAGWRRHSLRAAQSINGMSEAEREGFEPPVPLRVHLISNQTQSTSSAISPIEASIGHI